MHVVEGWASLAERVGPTLLVPVAAAVLVTILWALTGWSWFDLGPWPWAFGAVPVALLTVARLAVALLRHQRTTAALAELGRTFDSLSRELPADRQGAVLAALYLARARFGREGLRDLSAVLDEDSLDAVRSAEDPFSTALDRCSPADAEPVRSAVAAIEVAAIQSPPTRIPSLALTTLFLATLPVGLVTTTGWWTAVAIGGIALAYLCAEVVTESLERPLIGANAAPADAVLDITERVIARRSSAAGGSGRSSR